MIEILSNAKPHTRILISTGPIPAFLEPDIWLYPENGKNSHVAAFETARWLSGQKKFHVDLIAWEKQAIPDNVADAVAGIELMRDAQAYLDWCACNAMGYNCFLLFATLPSLLPMKPEQHTATSTAVTTYGTPVSLPFLPMPDPALAIRRLNSWCTLIESIQAAESRGCRSRAAAALRLPETLNLHTSRFLRAMERISAMASDRSAMPDNTAGKNKNQKKPDDRR